MHSSVRRALATLALAAVPFLAACNADQTPVAGTTATTTAVPSPDRLDLADVLGVPPAPTSAAVPSPPAAAPAPSTAGETPARPAPARPIPTTAAPAPRVTTPPAPAVVVPAPQSAPAPVADPCFRQDPECYDPPTVADCLAAEVWDGTQCVAVQTDDERIGRQVDGPDGQVCTVVAVNPDRLDCTPTSR